ncbi:HD-GYP domain-containing protein [Paenibacillus segetis]|uniref:Phosphodiesterase n=1 Tax=Paenibacillus segetis TaxID=1325360 RepID=A0ABQ1Y7J8_9BACL|nr:HD-GYP domain-containing protein [Paenibacillus segetis]GGH14337.1 phosphodiesterase [Paenibacillus segetis]
MRLVSVNSLLPGMKLGKKLYNEEGIVLLSENAELSDPIIRRLKSHGLDFVYVSDPRTDDIVIEDMITEETRQRALIEIRTNYRQLMKPAAKGLVYPYLGKVFSNLVDSIMDDLGSREDAMIMLMNINSMDQYLYRHSLNVCIYTILLGQIHGYSKDELTMLGMGAMLHDIGKTKVPLEVLNKPGKLTDEEFMQMKTHTEIGFKILKDEPGIPLVSAHCAYQHHERIDGSGYPRGIKKDEIHEFARWIAIADAFDAMTTHRVYRSAMLPHQALEVLYTGCDTWYEKSKLEVFRDRVAIYPLGMMVKLSTGERGVVSQIHGLIPHRPVIRILTDEFGMDIKSPYEVDLSNQLSVVITEVDNMGVKGA